MNLPFTVEQFMKVFESYNQAIWPMQILAYILGLIALYILLRKVSIANRAVSAILAIFWLWMGVAYHIGYFSEINKVANIFGALFIIQSILFIVFGVIKQRIVFDYKLDKNTVVGGLFIAYALVIYSLIGIILGHTYPRAPIFGVAPCPTAIFTFGLFLYTKKLPKSVLIIPLLWSIIGFVAALKLGIREDIGLLLAGLISTTMIVLRDRNTTKA